MSWAKFDDRYDDNEKVKRAWKLSPAAAAVHAHAITYSSRHETDGIVTVEWVQERFDIARMKDKDRREAIEALVSTGLFETVDGERFVVHDYLKFNPSSRQLDDRRRRDSERKRAKTPDGIHLESDRNPNGSHLDSTGSPNGIQSASRTPAGDTRGPSRPVPALPDPEGSQRG